MIDAARKKQEPLGRPDSAPKQGLPALHDPSFEQFYKRMSPNPNRGNYAAYASTPQSRPSHLSPQLHPSSSPYSGAYAEARPPPSHQAKNNPLAPETHMSANQIMIDFNTSKQMQVRRGSISGEKDARSMSPVTHPPPTNRTRDAGSPHIALSGHSRVPANIYPQYPGQGMNVQDFHPSQIPVGDARFASFLVDRSLTPGGHERQQSPSGMTWKPSPNSPNYVPVSFVREYSLNC